LCEVSDAVCGMYLLKIKKRLVPDYPVFESQVLLVIPTLAKISFGEGFRFYLLIIGNPFAFTVKSIDE